MFCKVDEAVGVKIAHTDGMRLSCLVGCLHCTISSVIVVERLVYEQQIHIIGLQLAQRLVNGFRCFRFAGVGNPYFGGKKNLFTGYSALAYRIADLSLVEIDLCRVDGSVTDVQGV